MPRSNDIIFTPVLDTAIYAGGDILFDMTELKGALHLIGGACEIRSLTVIDKANLGIALDLWIGSGGVSLGALNVAPTINAANAAANGLKALVSVATGDYKTVGPNVKIATKTALVVPFKATNGSNSLWIGALTQGGTPTYLANSLQIALGLYE